MKSLFFITLFFITLTTFAQRPIKGEGKPDFTPEQQAMLQSKRLTLALDLNQSQTNQVEALLLEKAKMQSQYQKLKAKRMESGERPTKEEIFHFRNKQIDARIEFQRQMKEILNKEQFEEWRRIKKNQHFRSKGSPHKTPRHPGMPPERFN